MSRPASPLMVMPCRGSMTDISRTPFAMGPSDVRGGQLERMDVKIPPRGVCLIGGDGDVIKPAPVVVIQNAVRLGGPNDLRHGVGEFSELPFIARVPSAVLHARLRSAFGCRCRTRRRKPRSVDRSHRTSAHAARKPNVLSHPGARRGTRTRTEISPVRPRQRGTNFFAVVRVNVVFDRPRSPRLPWEYRNGFL